MYDFEMLYTLVKLTENSYYRYTTKGKFKAVLIPICV